MGAKSLDEVWGMYEVCKEITRQEANNRCNDYVSWYNAALVLFSENISPDDVYLKKFINVDNRGNGYELYDNFKGTSGAFEALFLRIKKEKVSK